MNGYVPLHTMRGIQNYVENHVPPGSFLRAVFEHELFDAFMRADLDNRSAMFDIVNYINLNLPCACHGSPEKVAAWIKRGRESDDETTRDVPVPGNSGEGG